jgi:hypothetical protein
MSLGGAVLPDSVATNAIINGKIEAKNYNLAQQNAAISTLELRESAV